MRPTQPRTPTHDFDDLPPDLAFDAPPGDFVGDSSPYTGVDVLPDALNEAFQDPRARSKKPGRKPPLDLIAPSPRETSVARSARPASVCLSCGASPPEGGDCPHDEVAHLTDAPEALLAVVRKLQAAVAELHAQERALRRLVAAEVSSGRGDLQIPTRVAPVEREITACAHCGNRPVVTRAARRKAMLEAQATFFFAAPPPPVEGPPPEPAASVEEAAAPSAEAAQESPKRKRGRPRKSAEPALEEPVALPVEAPAEV